MDPTATPRRSARERESRARDVVLLTALALIGGAIAVVPPLRADFVRAATANLPFRWSVGPLPMERTTAPDAAVSPEVARRRVEWTERARAACLDHDLDPTLRLGAAEAFRRFALYGLGSADDAGLAVLEDVAADRVGDVAIDLLLIDVLRERILTETGSAALTTDAESRLADLLRVAERDGAGPIVDLIESWLQLGTRRTNEARDALVRAARTPGIDDGVRMRTAAAHRWLTSRGVADLDAREFLVFDEQEASALSIGETIDGIASAFASADASTQQRTGRADAAIPVTWRALDRAARDAVGAALLTRHAATGVSAAKRYRADFPIPSGVDSEKRALPDEWRRAFGSVRSERRFVPRRDVHRVAALRSFLVGWSLTLLAAAAVLVCCGRMRRRPADVPARPSAGRASSSLGLVFFAVLACPVLLFQSESDDFAASFGKLEDPCFLRALLPLVVLVPALLLGLRSAPARASGGAFTRLPRFAVRFAFFLLVIFAATYPLASAMRARQSRAIDAVLLDRAIRMPTHWPELGSTAP